MNRMLKFMLVNGCGMGSGIHIISASVRAKVGAIMNNTWEDVSGCRGSLVKSLIASAIGCSSP